MVEKTLTTAFSASCGRAAVDSGAPVGTTGAASFPSFDTGTSVAKAGDAKRDTSRQQRREGSNAFMGMSAAVSAACTSPVIPRQPALRGNGQSAIGSGP